VYPGRLQLFEDAAVAVGLRLDNQYGSFDGSGRYSGQPNGASELDLEQDFLGTVRVWRRGQIGLLVPIVETHYALAGMSDMGGGLGDVRLSGRWDFMQAGDDRIIPGIGVIAGVTFPTGTPIEESSPWGVTGFGAWQLSAGVSLEQTFGQIFAGVTALVSRPFSRTVANVDTQLGTRFTLIGAGGYVFDKGQALIGTLSLLESGDADVNGRTQPGSGERQLTTGVSAMFPISLTWRVQGSLFSDLPIAGQNHLTGFGLTLLLLRAWI
jgi:Putative MetA-pathway of phenol degradation